MSKYSEIYENDNYYKIGYIEDNSASTQIYEFVSIIQVNWRFCSSPAKENEQRTSIAIYKEWIFKMYVMLTTDVIKVSFGSVENLSTPKMKYLGDNEVS